MTPKATKVTVEFEDGLIVQSVGEHAQRFMDHADLAYPGIKEAKVGSWHHMERLDLDSRDFPDLPKGRIGLTLNRIEAIVIQPARDDWPGEGK